MHVPVPMEMVGNIAYSSWYYASGIKSYNAIPEQGTIYVSVNLESHNHYAGWREREIDWSPAPDEETILARISPKDPYRAAVIKYVETYRVSVAEESANGRVIAPAKLVRHGDDCIITIEADAGYELGNIQSLQGNEITKNADNTYTVKNITEPTKIAVEFSNTTGMPDVKNAGICIYPNPASSEIKISSPQTIHKTEIIDISGKTVYSGTETAISIEQFTKGMYIVKVYTDNNILNSKVIKQ